MKFNSALLATALIALTFAIPACDSGGDEAKKEEAGDTKEEKKKEVKEEKKEEAKEEKKEEAKEEGGDAGSIGIAECDELMKLMKCTIDKTPEAGRKAAQDAFEMSMKSWKDMAANEATKTAAADGCKQALEAGKAGYEAMGC